MGIQQTKSHLGRQSFSQLDSHFPPSSEVTVTVNFFSLCLGFGFLLGGNACAGATAAGCGGVFSKL